jgi:general secretion pathway protein B
MSFILDALKKSENDRQRQSGPALFEVRVAPPRSRFPLWAIAVAVLLVVNLSVIGWLMLRKPAAAASPSMQTSSTSAPSMPAPGAATPPVAAAQPALTGPPPVAQTTVPPAAVTAGAAQVPPLSTSTQGAEPALSEERSSATGANPDDYAPATEAPAPNSGTGSNSGTGTGLFGGHVTRGTSSGLPSYEEAATKTSIPPVRMDLHVYAPDPRKRFVLVNMKRMYEGDSLPDGVKVDSITPEGAVLSYHGTKFVLDRE